MLRFWLKIIGIATSITIAPCFRNNTNLVIADVACLDKQFASKALSQKPLKIYQ
jgi:hypothetical protein